MPTTKPFLTTVQQLANLKRLFSSERETNALREKLLIRALRGVCEYDQVSQPGAFLHGITEARKTLAKLGEG